MHYFNVFVILVAAFTIGNGILHDTFVLLQHKGPYDRTLLRLLMDGHILITCGAIYGIAFIVLNRGETIGYSLCILTSLSLLIYCGMIFPFLKSFVTITINLFILVLSIVQLFTLLA